MKIVYLAARQPYPAIKGDQTITYNQIKELSKKHEVFLITFCEHSEDELIKEMNKYCSGVTIFRDTRLKKFIATMKTLYNFKSIQANCFYRYSTSTKINKIIDEVSPDVVHAQSFRMAEYMMNSRYNKSIEMIDAYSLNMDKREKRTKSPLRLLWKVENNLLVKYEKKIIKNYKVKTIVAQRDKDYLDDESIVVNPIGISVDNTILNETRASRKKEHINVVFQGNMSYYPNIDAAEYLVLNILPKLRKKYNLKLYIVGGNPSKRVLDLKSEDIIVTGYVNNLENYLGKADIAIYPIESATGIQNKVLEAMASGVPTVISKACAEGIPGVKNLHNTLIANSEDEYMQHFTEIIGNQCLREKISNNALELIEHEYSWKRNVELLEKVWKKEFKW